jgi:hypothetical protein
MDEVEHLCSLSPKWHHHLAQSLRLSAQLRRRLFAEISGALPSISNVYTVQEKLEEDVLGKAVHPVRWAIRIPEHVLSSGASALGCEKPRPSGCVLQVSTSQTCIASCCSRLHLLHWKQLLYPVVLSSHVVIVYNSNACFILCCIHPCTLFMN